MVYASDEKAAAYNEIPMPLFIQGYLIVMKEEKQAVRTWMSTHLKDLMGDAPLYGWTKVPYHHVVWLKGG